MLNIRKYLAELMGVNSISDEDVRKELDELKIDNQVEELTRAGHVAADPETQALVRKGIAGSITPEELKQLLSQAKPAPAQTTTITPPSGVSAADTTEAAIQAEMTATGKPYHLAAEEVTKGGTIAPAAGGSI